VYHRGDSPLTALRLGSRATPALGADMTSDVQRGPPLWSIFCIPSTAVIGSAGARKTRRVRLRLAVGWRPPAGRPSGAGPHARHEGVWPPLNVIEGDPTPGLRLVREPAPTFEALRQPCARSFSRGAAALPGHAPT